MPCEPEHRGGHARAFAAEEGKPMKQSKFPQTEEEAVVENEAISEGASR